MGRRMGTIVNFKENIEYQKKNLQEVYKSYFNIKNQNDLESEGRICSDKGFRRNR